MCDVQLFIHAGLFISGALPPQYTYVTASTGVAACHVGGTTLHAFAGNY